MLNENDDIRNLCYLKTIGNKPPFIKPEVIYMS